MSSVCEDPNRPKVAHICLLQSPMTMDIKIFPDKLTFDCHNNKELETVKEGKPNKG